MKAIIQRVTKASVSVDGQTVSSVKNGLCVLVGISRKDAAKDADWLARKILNLRLFDDDDGKRWCKSVMDKQYEILCVSQFTLCVQLKGNKPDFHDAMGPDQSQQFYEDFLKLLKQNYCEEKIKDGVFGADMIVSIDNDGPVTIPMESPAGLPELKVRKPQNNKKASGSNQEQTHTTENVSSESQGATGSS